MWQSWDTAQASQNHAEFWSDVVVHGVLDAEMRAKDSRDFSGVLASRTVAGTRFVSFSSAAHQISRTAQQAGRGHAHVMVSLQCRGVSHLCQGERQIAVHPGEIAVLDSARAFTIDFPEEVERRLVLLPRHLTESWPLRLQDGPRIVPGDSAAMQIARYSIQRLTSSADDWDQEDCRDVTDALTRLLRAAFRGAPAPEDKAALLRLGMVKAEIDRCLHQPHLTPVRMARALGISLRSLHRLFEAEGQTFTRYLFAERLKRARCLIIQQAASSLSLTQIALDCGFADASQFSRSYRNHFGETPSDSRKLARAASAH